MTPSSGIEILRTRLATMSLEPYGVLEELPSLIALTHGLSRIDGTPCWLPPKGKPLNDPAWAYLIPALLHHEGPMEPFLSKLEAEYELATPSKCLLRAKLVVLGKRKPTDVGVTVILRLS